MNRRLEQARIHQGHASYHRRGEFADREKTSCHAWYTKPQTEEGMGRWEPFRETESYFA